MARFDVLELVTGRHLVVDCQSNLLDHLNTRFVVPLLPVDRVPSAIARLNPTFKIEGKELLMTTQLATSVPVKSIRRVVLSLGEGDHIIMRALDALISDT